LIVAIHPARVVLHAFNADLFEGNFGVCFVRRVSRLCWASDVTGKCVVHGLGLFGQHLICDGVADCSAPWNITNEVFEGNLGTPHV